MCASHDDCLPPDDAWVTHLFIDRAILPEGVNIQARAPQLVLSLTVLPVLLGLFLLLLRELSHDHAEILLRPGDPHKPGDLPILDLDSLLKGQVLGPQRHNGGVIAVRPGLSLAFLLFEGLDLELGLLELFLEGVHLPLPGCAGPHELLEAAHLVLGVAGGRCDLRSLSLDVLEVPLEMVDA